MSLSSSAPGVMPGWESKGKRGNRRIKRMCKKFVRKFKRIDSEKERRRCRQDAEERRNHVSR